LSPDVLAGLPSVALIIGAFLAAGTVKGVAGVGLPLTALGILTTQTDPRTAIALALVPIFLSNLWQFLSAGGVLEALRRYLPFLVVMVIGIPLTLLLTSGIDESLLLGILGLTFLLYVVINATRWAPDISDENDFLAQIGFGALAGLLGGLTSLWLPAIVVYLSARQVKKDEFVRATGLMLFTGSIPLLAGYWHEGYLTGPLAGLSAALMLPTLVGLVLGAQLRKRLSEAAFKRVLLVVFVLVGLNLIRRAIMG
jgi:uncharacterized membrane protein YfcA